MHYNHIIVCLDKLPLISFIHRDTNVSLKNIVNHFMFSYPLSYLVHNLRKEFTTKFNEKNYFLCLLM